MTQAKNREQFNQVVGDVMAYYRQNVTPFTLNLWWETFKSYDLQQLSKAFSKHATDPEHGQFAPKVADIVRIIEGTPTDRAAIAWGKTLEAISSIGSYTDVVFDDPIIHAVITDLGGWVKLCSTETKELSYVQHKFCESYKAYKRAGSFEYPRLLSSLRSPDEEFAMKGLKPPKAAFVGDREAAKIVYKNGSKSNQSHLSLASLAEKSLGLTS